MGSQEDGVTFAGGLGSTVSFHQSQLCILPNQTHATQQSPQTAAFPIKPTGGVQAFSWEKFEFVWLQLPAGKQL